MKGLFPVAIAALVFSLPLAAQTARERAEKLVAPATAGALRNPPAERFVWTASTGADGRECLDVPEMVTEAFTREAAKLRTPIPGRQ